MVEIPILQVSGLTKYYKGSATPAVDNVTFDVLRSEILGLVGPNGAGKTTTISIISSLLKPSLGSIKIENLEIADNLKTIKGTIGVVAQEIALYDKLTAFENLFYYGGLHGIRKAELTERISYLLNRLGLMSYAHNPIKTFSGGMKRRINLVSGILHDPRLLILDEPTAGVDVQTRNVIREFLFELKEKGTSIIYTSHLIDDIEKLCDRICIIDQGKMLASGTPAGLVNACDNCHTLEDVFINYTGKKLRDS
jgi:ABC-2 type transport system ATP-binding protein